MPDALELRNVTKTFRNGAVALEDVTLAVDPGTFLVLLGPSGSGKTTLLRSVAGIERISDGRIVIGDTVVAEGKVHVLPERRNLSMVFQDYALWPHLRAADNVAFALIRSGVSPKERRRHAEQMLQRVGLGQLYDRYPAELSGGEQQRVALARALVGSASLVLCDEPLSNLDADLRERMRVQISELVRESGSTTVYITHDQAEAFALADRVGVLEKGRLVQFGTPEAIYLHPVTPFVARFTGVAAELPIRTERSAKAGDEVRAEIEGGFSTRAVVAEAGEDLLPGRGTLLVRPAAVRVTTPHSHETHLSGTVIDVAFRGRGYELAVKLPNGERINQILAAERRERGSRIGLQLGPGGCVVFSGIVPPDAPGAPSAEKSSRHETGGRPGDNGALRAKTTSLP